MDGGIYQLLLRLPAPLAVTVGALGRCQLPAGWLVYTGSMRRGLRHRLSRHCRREKPLRWHIDYLTSTVPVVAVRVFPLAAVAAGCPPQECATHRALAAWPGARLPVAGFGSSDCRCTSHLLHLGASATVWDRCRNGGFRPVTELERLVGLC